MGLLDQIRKDVERFVSNIGDFAVNATFTDNAYNNATISCLYTRHSTKIDGEGSPVNSKNASVCVSEQKLLDAGYTTRNDENELDMYGHFVSFIDSTGVNKKCKIIEQLPDESVGLIVFILSDYAAD